MGQFTNVVEPNAGRPAYRCPCCRCLTLSEPGGHEICQVCFWQDDGQDAPDASEVRGGPNYELSLLRARANYLSFGASCQSVLLYVRPPTGAERA